MPLSFKRSEGWVVESVTQTNCDRCKTRRNTMQRHRIYNARREGLAELLKGIGRTEDAAVLSTPEIQRFERMISDGDGKAPKTHIDTMFGYRWVVVFAYRHWYEPITVEGPEQE